MHFPNSSQFKSDVALSLCVFLHLAVIPVRTCIYHKKEVCYKEDQGPHNRLNIYDRLSLDKLSIIQIKSINLVYRTKH